jgi:hypothetical protein
VEGLRQEGRARGNEMRRTRVEQGMVAARAGIVIICYRYATIVLLLCYFTKSYYNYSRGLPSCCFKRRTRKKQVLVKQRKITGDHMGRSITVYGLGLHLTPHNTHTRLYLKKKAPKCHAARTFQSSISEPVPCAWFWTLWGTWQGSASVIGSLSLRINSPNRSLSLTHTLPSNMKLLSP